MVRYKRVSDQFDHINTCLALVLLILIVNYTYNISGDTIHGQDKVNSNGSLFRRVSSKFIGKATNVANKKIVNTQNSVTFYLKLAARYYKWHKDIGRTLENEADLLRSAYTLEDQTVTDQLCAEDRRECESLGVVWLILTKVIERLEFSTEDGFNSEEFVASTEDEKEDSMTRLKNTLKTRFYQCLWAEAKDFVAYTIKMYTFYAISALFQDAASNQLETLVALALIRFAKYEDRFYAKYILKAPKRTAIKLIKSLSNSSPDISKCDYNNTSDVDVDDHEQELKMTNEIEGTFELYE